MSRIIRKAEIKTKIFISICLFFVSCSSPQESEQDKIRQLNAKGEFIYRKNDEKFHNPKPLKARTHEKYPWEESYSGTHVKITKEYFRCKGSALNPPYTNVHNKDLHYVDCEGAQKHSLPLKDNKEYIYPILLDLLNYIQDKTGKKVIITCGHRCPAHNAYADPAISNQTSKHMIGAEVDFFVQGLENQPQKIVDLIMAFYKGKKDFEKFQRYDKTDTNVSTPPWYNKEVFIKLFKKDEGRDLDNKHPHPYLCLQVRYDRETQERVIFQWPKAMRLSKN